MKLVLFDDYKPGALLGDCIVDLSDAVGSKIMSLPGPVRMAEIIADYPQLGPLVAEGMTTGQTRAVGEVVVRAPIQRPGKLIFAAANYNEQIEGIHFPIDMFLKAPSSLLGPGGTVCLPPDDAQLFFHEAELGVVIGQPASRVSAAQAMDHVFGYTAVIDVSSYGLPGQIGGIRNKSFDTFCPIGPCITTSDEVGDPQRLGVRLWVDRQLRQNYNTSDMEHPVAELIEFASHIMTLEPGDVIACGTSHAGLGPIQDGEEMRIEIDLVGGFTVSVFDPRRRRWPVGPDPTMEAGVIQLKKTGVPPESYFNVRPFGDPDNQAP